MRRTSRDVLFEEEEEREISLTSKFDRLSVNDDIGEFLGDEHSRDFRARHGGFVRFQQMMSIDGTAALQPLTRFTVHNAVTSSIGSSWKRDRSLPGAVEERFLQIIIGLGIRASSTGWILLQMIHR